MMASSVVIHPIVSSIQKINLYETKARFYLIGSNNTQNKFRVLKIDRMEPKELVVIDDKVEYNHREINDLLKMIEYGNISRQGQKYVGGLNRIVSSFGIVGFVKFMEGYYLILITKRRRVALIGHHTIYKIQDTCMIYIPSEGDKSLHPNETKYVKLFQSMDLSSNFYFSYSYDITHTLQYNMSSLKTKLSILNDSQEIDQTKTTPFWNPQFTAVENAEVEVANNFLDSLRTGSENYSHKSGFTESGTLDMSSSGESLMWSELRSNDDLSAYPRDFGQVHIGVKIKPQWRFVWNAFLLEPVDLHPDWLLFITHGFVGQSNINVYGRSIYLTLIARRSARFAGTRFLKRGTNDKGDVANEVETEQIVFDSSVSLFQAGRFTSFVQMRGSIPSQWSQDISKIVPKPPIMLDLADPYCCYAGQHFNDLLQRYGSPIVVLNLVKRREQKRHESILSEEFCDAISYLNQFLSPDDNIINIGFDMAHINKSKDANVMQRLAHIAYSIIGKTGIFHSHPAFYCQTVRPYNKKKFSLGGHKNEDNTRIQTGVVRVNCVDCLDRTNTAQFALGKAALAFQMYVLGVLESPTLEFDTDSVRMLEELYEDHGDTLALQYGGSQLVHRVKTYRKIAPLSSHSRDIMQTLSRYYSNTFSDADKQNAINLFLGVYKPGKSVVPLWDLPTDYYLHNSVAAGQLVCHRNMYTCWWDPEVAKCLPGACIEVRKGLDDSILEIIKTYPLDPRIDEYFDHYRPFEMTSMDDLLTFTMNPSIIRFTDDYSPFSVRVQSGKRRDACDTKPPNPSVTGISSTASASSGTSDTESGESSSEENFIIMHSEESSASLATCQTATFESMFTTMKKVYGVELQKPCGRDLKLYERHAEIGKVVGKGNTPPMNDSFYGKAFSLQLKSNFMDGSVYGVTPPIVSKADKDIYRSYVQRGQVGPSSPSQRSLAIYEHYCTIRSK